MYTKKVICSKNNTLREVMMKKLYKKSTHFAFKRKEENYANIYIVLD